MIWPRPVRCTARHSTKGRCRLWRWHGGLYHEGSEARLWPYHLWRAW